MIHTTDAQRAEIRRKIVNGEFWSDEKVWTYLVAHCLSDSEHRREYFRLVAGDRNPFDVWFEAQPLPPRRGVARNTEGNSKLDLSFGAIRPRCDTAAGIEYDRATQPSLVCFVEAKLFSDCSADVSYDPLRNQIARVIDNLLCFQSAGMFPDRLVFTLLTPRLFKNNPTAKLYGYKMAEYNDSKRLIADIRMARIPERSQDDWHYPSDLEGRTRHLVLRWVCYEDILERELGMGRFDLVALHATPTVRDRLETRLRTLADELR
jgi:hypothetical protein